MGLGRRARILVTGAIAASAIAIAVAPPIGGGSGLANIWIDTNGGTCTDSATPVAYNDATACTPDAANDTCEGGDSVGIRSGTYGNWTITKAGANSGRSSMCVMTVEDGGSVVMGNLNLGEVTGGDTGPDWLTIQGNETQFAGCRDKAEGTCSLRMAQADIDGDTQNTIANFESDSGRVVAQCFHVEGSSNITVKRGKIHSCDAAGTTGAMMMSPSATNYTIEDMLVYDAFLRPGETTHTECFWGGGNGLTIRRSHFWGCPTEIIFLTGSTTFSNMVIENSIFQRPAGPNDNSFKFRDGSPTSSDPAPVNLIMRNNLFQSVTGLDAANAGLSSGTVANNFTKGGNVLCPTAPGTIVCVNNDTSEPDSSFVSPIWTSSSDENAPSVKGNFTITSSSGLRNTGSNANCPSDDFNGNPRPFGGGICDIGPYEYQG